MTVEKPQTRNILTVIDSPHWGGPQVVVERTSQFFPGHGYQRFVALPLATKDMGKRLQKAGCTVIDMPLHRIRKTFNPIVHLRYLLSLRRDVRALCAIIRKYRIDIVEAASLLNFQPVLAARLTGIPLVWQIHSMLAPRLVRILVGYLAMKLSRVVMTSGRGIIGAHGSLTIDGAPIVPFCAPVSVEDFRPDPAVRSRVRRHLGYTPNDIVVGTLGNRAWAKRHEYIIEIAHRLRDQSFKFAIAGMPVDTNIAYYKAKVIAPIHALNLTDSVKIVDGNMPASELMNAFDIFILPSISEAASLVTAEAMATGLPIVASDAGSIPDSVSHGENGYLCGVHSIDAFCQALLSLRDPALRKKMGQTSLKKVRAEISDRNCADAHFTAYALALT